MTHADNTILSPGKHNKLSLFLTVAIFSGLAAGCITGGGDENEDQYAGPVAVVNVTVNGADEVSLAIAEGVAARRVTGNSGAALAIPLPTGRHYSIRPGKTGFVFAPASAVVPSFSTDTSITFDAVKPDAPHLEIINPDDAVIEAADYRISWVEAADANGYSVQFSPKPEFFLFYANKHVESTSTVLYNTVAAPTVVYVRVRPSSGAAATVWAGPYAKLLLPRTEDVHSVTGTVTAPEGMYAITVRGDAEDIRFTGDGGAFEFVLDEGGSYTFGVNAPPGMTADPAVVIFDELDSGKQIEFTVRLQ